MPTLSFDDPGVTQGFAYALQLALGATFLASVIPKLWRPGTFRRVVAGYDLFPRWATATAAIVIATEAFLTVSFLTGWLLRIAVALAAVTVAAFAVATAVNLRRGREIQCGCFGSTEERVSGRSLARLALMACATIALAAGLAAGATSPTTVTWLASRGPSSLAYVVEIAAVSLSLTLPVLWALHGRETITVLRAAWAQGEK